MTIVRKAFHIASVSNGEDAVSYEIVPSTSALSVDANGNWASGTALWDQDKSYAVVKCYVYKVVGSKRELCKGTMLYHTAEGSRVSRSVFNNGFFYVYIDKSANVIDACVYAFNMAIGKPVGDPLAMTSITINHDGANGKPIVSYEIRLDTDSVTADGKTGKFLSKDLGRFHFIKHTGDKSEELSKVLDSDNYIIIYVGHDGKTAEYSLGDGSDDIYDCLMMNTEEEAVSLMKFFWYDAPVYVSNGNDKGYDYVEELKATQGIPTEHMNLKILASAVFTVIRQPKDGERGSAGATWRHHKDFVDSSETEPYEYMSGGNDEKFIDVVWIGKILYRCILRYESTGRTDTRNIPGSSEFGKYWSAADMSMAFIATDFFLAENAKINLFGSNEINLYSSNEDGKIFGSFRVPNGNGDGPAYALWLGAETGSEAPFSVTSKGRLVATDVNISGTVYAMDGKIAGLKIDGAGLTNEGFDNDAHITLRNDANNTYARIGGNVLPGTSSGMTAVAMFTNGKKAESIADVNCALVCGASGAATNVAIDMTNGGYVMGLRIKTARLSSGGSSQKYPVSIPKGVNSVILGGGGYYQLPEMSKEDDGYVIMVKNDNSGNVHLMTNISTTYKGEVKKSFILYNRGDNTEDLTIDSRGDAMIFVYHRDVSLSGSSTKSGCWVQYKCPRDW